LHDRVGAGEKQVFPPPPPPPFVRCIVPPRLLPPHTGTIAPCFNSPLSRRFSGPPPLASTVRPTFSLPSPSTLGYVIRRLELCFLPSCRACFWSWRRPRGPQGLSIFYQADLNIWWSTPRVFPPLFSGQGRVGTGW